MAATCGCCWGRARDQRCGGLLARVAGGQQRRLTRLQRCRANGCATDVVSGRSNWEKSSPGATCCAATAARGRAHVLPLAHCPPNIGIDRLLPRADRLGPGRPTPPAKLAHCTPGSRPARCRRLHRFVAPAPAHRRSCSGQPAKRGPNCAPLRRPPSTHAPFNLLSPLARPACSAGRCRPIPRAASSPLPLAPPPAPCPPAPTAPNTPAGATAHTTLRTSCTCEAACPPGGRP